MIIYRTKLFFTNQELLDKYLKGHPDEKKDLEIESSWREKRQRDMKKFNESIKKKHAAEVIRKDVIISPRRLKFSEENFDPNFLSSKKIEELKKLSGNPNTKIKYHGEKLNLPGTVYNGLKNNCYDPYTNTLNLTDSGLNDYTSKHEAGHASSVNNPLYRMDREELDSWERYIRKVVNKRKHQNDEYDINRSVDGRKLSSYKLLEEEYPNRLLYKDKFTVPNEELANKCAFIDNFMLNGDPNWMEKYNSRRENIQEPNYKLEFRNKRLHRISNKPREKDKENFKIRQEKLSPDLLDVAMTDSAGKDFRDKLKRYKSLSDVIKEAKQEYRKTGSEEAKNILKEKLADKLKLLRELRR